MPPEILLTVENPISGSARAAIAALVEAMETK
jgi:hypothetical protein